MVRLIALLSAAPQGHWQIGGGKESVLAQGLSCHTDNSDNDGRARNTRSSIECCRHRNWLQYTMKWIRRGVSKSNFPTELQPSYRLITIGT
jgi:hypothetical protein